MTLTERPPEAVTVGGVSYPINSDFRACVAFEQAAVRGETNAGPLLRLFFPREFPPDGESAVDALLWFYRCGTDAPECRGSNKTSARGYDFEQDADALQASFLAAYGIDLSTASLHWWTFRALMLGLPEDTQFMRRVYFRTAETAGMSKEQRKHVLKMRKRYELRSTAAHITLEERNRRMQEYVARRFAEVEECKK